MKLIIDNAARNTSIDWKEVYEACRLHRVGISYARFIEAPEATLAQLGMHDALEIMATGFLPLLPAQARVRQEIGGSQPDRNTMKAKEMWSCRKDGHPAYRLLPRLTPAHEG